LKGIFKMSLIFFGKFASIFLFDKLVFLHCLSRSEKYAKLNLSQNNGLFKAKFLEYPKKYPEIFAVKMLNLLF